MLCVAIAVVLVFSEAFVAHHECVDDHCVLCAISLSVKFVLYAVVCAMVCIACTVCLPRVGKSGARCFSLVSSKAKLTI